MKDDEKTPAWAQITGAAIVASILLLIALNAIGGWEWTSGFLVSSAPGWVQAIGALAAIYAAWRIASDQRGDKAETDKAVAHITLLRMLKVFRQVSALHHSLTITLPKMKAAASFTIAPEVVHRVLELAGEPPTDEQLMRVATLHPQFAKHFAEALTLIETIRLTTSLKSEPTSSVQEGAEFLEMCELVLPLIGRNLAEAERLLPSALKDARGSVVAFGNDGPSIR